MVLLLTIVHAPLLIVAPIWYIYIFISTIYKFSIVNQRPDAVEDALILQVSTHRKKILTELSYNVAILVKRGPCRYPKPN